MRPLKYYDAWKKLLREEASNPDSLLVERMCQKLGPVQTAVLCRLILSDTEEEAFAGWGSTDHPLWHKAVTSLRDYVLITPTGIDLRQLFEKVNLEGDERPITEQLQLEAQTFDKDNHAIAHTYYRVTGNRVTQQEWAIIGKMLHYTSRQRLIGLIMQRCWMGRQTIGELLPLVISTSEAEEAARKAAQRGRDEREEQAQRFEGFLKGEVRVEPTTAEIIRQMRLRAGKE